MRRELEEKGEGTLVARQVRVKALDDLMSPILHQSVESSFCCVSQVMTQNKIVIPTDEIQDDMLKRATQAQVKTFTN